MGMFDTVLVPCASCGNNLEFQSKSGDRCLFIYDLAEAPEDVLRDVNRHGSYECPKCRVKTIVGIRDGQYVSMSEDEALHSTVYVTNRDVLAARTRAAIIGGIREAAFHMGMWNDLRSTAVALAQDAVTKIYRIPKETVDECLAAYEKEQEDRAKGHQEFLKSIFGDRKGGVE